jgi:hypothetical protein
MTTGTFAISLFGVLIIGIILGFLLSLMIETEAEEEIKNEWEEGDFE